jgi:uracil-DNA glycosylase
MKQIIDLSSIHPSWQPLLEKGLQKMNPAYLSELNQSAPQWLPGPQSLMNAFSLPFDSVRYILLGESPYPRPQSANGYAFWDAAVTDLWSTSGLSKTVNRATSLRNFIKMLLVADQQLDQDTGQPAIASLDKSAYTKTVSDLFGNMLNQGFLLLNASLVLSSQPKQYDAKQWAPFIEFILHEISKHHRGVRIFVFGNFAQKISMPVDATIVSAEHPYNISFVHNPIVIENFAPLNLLRN